MEYRSTQTPSVAERPEPGPDTVGIVDCSHRFATMVGELADATADEEVEVLQTLVDDCVELQDVHAAVVTLDSDNGLRAAASSPGARPAAKAIDAHSDGPGLLAYRIGEPVIVNRLEDARPYWPAFAEAVLEQGYQSTRAVPMSGNDHCIGALNLFSHEAAQTGEVTWLAQTMAEVVTSGVLQRRRLDEALQTTEQLQHALDSRVVIEQAKGILAERYGMTTSECFEWLRGYCRDRNLRMREVATAIVDDGLLDDQVVTFSLE